MNITKAKKITKQAILTKDKKTIQRYLKRYFELKFTKQKSLGEKEVFDEKDN